MGNKSLKSQNRWRITAFVVFNIVVFWLIYVGQLVNLSNADTLWRQIMSKGGIGIPMMPIVAIVVVNILSTRLKMIIVFWRVRHSVPGARAFSKIAKRDDRIDYDRLEALHGDLPKHPREQNQLWYKIYKKHQNKINITDSHRSFLLIRDLTSASVIFLLFFGCAVFMKRVSENVVYGYMAFLLIQYLALSVVARNLGNRLVCNVLAEETAA